MEEEIEETYGHWDDDSFVSELKEREAEYNKGTARAYSIKETVHRAKQAIKKAKKKS